MTEPTQLPPSDPRVAEMMDRIFNGTRPPKSPQVKEEEIHDLIWDLLDTLGEDRRRPGLEQTPNRVAKAYVQELFTGYGQDPSKVVTVFPAESKDLVIVNDLPVYSFCEHHILPIVGVAHIAYIPDQSILGLSKFGRLVDVFARRLQVQERLTSQVADSLMEIVQPLGVIVIIEARHMCMEMRGISAYNTWTKTSAIRGIFEEDQAARSEVLSLIRK